MSDAQRLGTCSPNGDALRMRETLLERLFCKYRERFVDGRIALTGGPEVRMIAADSPQRERGSLSSQIVELAVAQDVGYVGQLGSAWIPRAGDERAPNNRPGMSVCVSKDRERGCGSRLVVAFEQIVHWTGCRSWYLDEA